MTSAISAEIVELYRGFYGHDRATATTYINDNVVVCVLEDILTTAESTLVSGRDVVAFLSANQTDPGIASELFFLKPMAETDEEK